MMPKKFFMYAYILNFIHHIFPLTTYGLRTSVFASNIHIQRKGYSDNFQSCHLNTRILHECVIKIFPQNFCIPYLEKFLYTSGSNIIARMP